METSQKLDASSIEVNKHYVLKTDKHGTEYKVVNLDNEEICPRKGIVEFEAIRKSKRGGNECSFSNFTDPETGITWGIWMGIDPERGTPRWQRITLKNTTVFNRMNPTEAKQCAIAMVAPFREGSHLKLSGGKIKYRLKDKEGEAIKKIQLKNERERANEVVKGLKGPQLRDMALNMGIPIEGNSDTVILAELWDKSDVDPKHFLKVWDDPNRTSLTILKKAIENGVCAYDHGAGYSYSSIFLGTDEPTAVFYLSENPNVCSAIEAKTKLIIEQSSRSNVAVAKPVNQAEIELEATKKELEALKAQIASGQNIVTNTEFDELMKRGKELKIPGIHLVKDLEKLRAKVQEKEAEVTAQ